MTPKPASGVAPPAPLAVDPVRTPASAGLGVVGVRTGQTLRTGRSQPWDSALGGTDRLETARPPVERRGPVGPRRGAAALKTRGPRPAGKVPVGGRGRGPAPYPLPLPLAVGLVLLVLGGVLMAWGLG